MKTKRRALEQGSYSLVQSIVELTVVLTMAQSFCFCLYLYLVKLLSLNLCMICQHYRVSINFECLQLALSCSPYIPFDEDVN